MAESPHIIQLDESNFVQVVVEGSDQQPVLVDFWADWCGPCKSLMPILEKLAVEYNGAFILAKLDTEAHPAIAQQLGIRSLPTVKLFKDRQLVDEFMGALPEAEVRKFLDQHIVAADESEQEATEPASPGLEAAMQLAEQGELTQARTLLQTMQAENPEDKDVLLALGQVCVSLGDLDTAASCCSALPEEEQGSNAALRLAGTIELAKEAEGETLDREALQSECNSNPDNSEARYKLAIATALSGDMQSAMDHLLQLVQKDPSYNEGAPRTKLLALFNIMGDDPIVGVYRRKLFAMLH